MAGTFITYFCYEEFFGSCAPEAALIEELSQYDGHSILHFIRQVNTELEIWRNGVETDALKYTSRVYALLPNILGEQLVLELRRKTNGLPGRAFFHTRQLLYLAKIALRDCPLGKGVTFGADGCRAGLTLLKVNDQFHIKDRSGANASDDETRDYALMSEFIAVNEFVDFDEGDLLLRAYRMLFELPPEAAGQSFFLDFNAIFKRQTGLCLDQYFAMCFSLCVSTFPQFYSRMNSALTFGSDFWAKSDLPLETIDMFWREVSINVTTARKYLGGDAGSSDVTLFRKWPLVQLDNVRFGFYSRCFLEKLWAGPFWTIFASSDKARDEMPRFTGWLFEQYLRRFVLSNCSGPNEFIPAPKKATDGLELTDGLILCGSALILLEYKSVMFTAEAKYSGNRELLRKEVEKKLVKNQFGKAKGVTQLRKAIEYLSSSDLGSAVNAIDLSNVTRIYPLIVTLEPLGDGLIVSRVLNREFQRQSCDLAFANVEIKRLHCTSVATLERIAGTFSSSSLAEMLDEWDQADPPLRGSWRMYFDPSRHATGKEFNRSAFEKMDEHLRALLQLHE